MPAPVFNKKYIPLNLDDKRSVLIRAFWKALDELVVSGKMCSIGQSYDRWLPAWKSSLSVCQEQFSLSLGEESMSFQVPALDYVWTQRCFCAVGQACSRSRFASLHTLFSQECSVPVAHWHSCLQTSQSEPSLSRTWTRSLSPEQGEQETFQTHSFDSKNRCFKSGQSQAKTVLMEYYRSTGSLNFQTTKPMAKDLGSHRYPANNGDIQWQTEGPRGKAPFTDNIHVWNFKRNHIATGKVQRTKFIL